MVPSYASLIDDLTPAMYRAGEAIMAAHQKMRDAGLKEAGLKEVRLKEDGSPVSEADEASEAILLEALGVWAPDIQIISEENATSHGLVADEIFFLVDPLDGTKEFLKQDGTGGFTVNIGLVKRGFPVLGLVYAPALDLLYSGFEGGGAFLIRGRGGASGDKTKESIRVRARPSSGLVAVASASHRDEQTDSWLAENKIGQTLSIGSSLKFCLVAEGRADVYPRFGPTMEWDIAAGDAVLRAAGGSVRNPAGDAFVYGKEGYRNGAFIARAGG